MTKQKLLEYIRQYSKDGFSTQANAAAIGELLGVSRNLISQYLNEFHSAGQIVKVKSRPVCFYDVQSIEEKLGRKPARLEFASHAALHSYIADRGQLDFAKLIGADTSLAKIVEQCKATVSYPPDGLPILLHGPSGSGKSYMAQLIYEYAVNKGILTQDSPFITLNCSDYANNPELLTDNLFGHRKGAYTGAESDNDGLVKLADGGFLFLDEIHSLTPECQEKLFLYMDKGIYHVMGDNETWYSSSARLIFATTESPQDALLKTLLRRIPVVLKIPALKERREGDKAQLIRYFFQQEEVKMNRSIALTPVVCHTLLNADYTGDVGELKNTIKASCISAHFAAGKELAGKASRPLLIRVHDLPEKLLLGQDFNPGKSLLPGGAEIAVQDLADETDGKNDLADLYQKVLRCFAEKPGKERLQGLLDQMHDYLYTEMLQYKEAQNRDFVSDTVRQILNMVSDKYKLYFSNNFSLAIANYVEFAGRSRFQTEGIHRSHSRRIEDLCDYVTEELPLEYRIAQEITASLELYLDSDMEPLLKVLLACNIYLMNRQVHSKQIGVILAHGYSTASSIAEAANAILDQYVFESIDMPLQVSVDTVVAKLDQWLEGLRGYEEILILVDMGSLEEIHQGLSNHSSLNIGIINNVTTRMAIAVGEGIRRQEPVDVILDTARAACAISSKVIRRRHREDIILCSCASGIGTADRLKAIVADSLPEQGIVKVVACDYHQLLEKEFREQLKKSYNILCVIGTLNPGITGPDLYFLPLDGLISGEVFPALDASLGGVLTEKELQTFKENILKNFSLLNIVNNLTILNPDKVIDQVMDALGRLQALEGTIIKNSAAVGLYVHVCCLIEKLITRQNPGNYLGMELFRKKHKTFIQNVQEAFRSLEQYYNVEIPEDEIGYLYDYVYGPEHFADSGF